MKKLLLLATFILNLAAATLHSQSVYITNTGEKYHRSDCRYLSHSKIATELKDALAGGYEPCKVCQPPQAITAPQYKSTSQHDSHSEVGRTATSVQCSGNTQAGNRCKRMTKSSNGKCFQHGG